VLHSQKGYTERLQIVTNRINNGSLWLPIEPFASYVMFFMISLFFVVDILICRIDFALIPLAVRCKVCVCRRSRVRFAGSSPAAGMDVRLLEILCVVSERFLRWADHSSRGVRIK